MLTSTDFKDVASQMRPIEGRYRSVGIISQVKYNFKIQKLVLAVISVNSISIIRKFIMFDTFLPKLMIFSKFAPYILLKLGWPIMSCLISGVLESQLDK